MTTNLLTKENVDSLHKLETAVGHTASEHAAAFYKRKIVLSEAMNTIESSAEKLSEAKLDRLARASDVYKQAVQAEVDTLKAKYAAASDYIKQCRLLGILPAYSVERDV